MGRCLPLKTLAWIQSVTGTSHQNLNNSFHINLKLSCVSTMEQADATIIIKGGHRHETYTHSSLLLSRASRFFASAFAKKGKKSVVFAARASVYDPRRYWREVRNFFTIGETPPPIVDERNVAIFAYWFHGLQVTIPSLLSLCDDVYTQHLLKDGIHFFPGFSKTVWDALKLGITYEFMSNTKKNATRMLQEYLGQELGHNISELLTAVHRLEIGGWSPISVQPGKLGVVAAADTDDHPPDEESQSAEKMDGQLTPSKRTMDALAPSSHIPTVLKDEWGFEQDLKVVIGGKSFNHSCEQLVASSRYFEGSLTHDMRERNDMTVRWPDDDPAEWEIVKDFLTLCTRPTPITRENAPVLLRWFDRLCVKKPESVQRTCDWTLARSLQPTGSQSNLKLVLHHLRLGFNYHLKETTKRCISILSDMFDREMVLFILFAEAKSEGWEIHEVWTMLEKDGGFGCFILQQNAKSFEAFLYSLGTKLSSGTELFPYDKSFEFGNVEE